MQSTLSPTTARGWKMGAAIDGLFTQFFYKTINVDYVDFWKIDVPQNIVVMILSDNEMSSRLEGTIHKFIIVWILMDQLQVKINLDLQCVGQVEDGRNNVTGNSWTHFLGKDFLVLSENLIGVAQHIFTTDKTTLYGIVLTAARERHQQVVRVKDNIHYWRYGVRMCSCFHSSMTSSLRMPSSHRRSISSSARLAKYSASIRRMSSISSCDCTCDTNSSICIWNGENAPLGMFIPSAISLKNYSLLQNYKLFWYQQTYYQ